MATTYKVVKGDTLWDIVQKPAYKNLIAGNTINAKIKTLAKINNIPNPDYIVVGQTLKLSGSTAKAASTTSGGLTNGIQFGVISNDESGKYREMYAAWTFTIPGAKEYEYKWTYTRKAGNTELWVTGATSKTTDKACFWTAPEDAVRVNFCVRALDGEGKAVSKWIYSSTKWTFVDAPPKPPTPTVLLDAKRLFVTVNDSDGDLGGTSIVFQVVENNDSIFEKSDRIPIKTGYASWYTSGVLREGRTYKVRCYVVNKAGLESVWSDYSTPIASRPSTPKIEVLKADSENLGDVYLKWTASSVKNSALKLSYEIQYVAKDKSLFDISDKVSSITVEDTTEYILSSVGFGELYYFRIRGVSKAEGNTTGGDVSDWSEIKSLVIGEKPEAPTTWSSAATVIHGEIMNLYWVHNSKDGSSEKSAILRYRKKGDASYNEVEIINNLPKDERDDTKVYRFDTSQVSYAEGAEIEWSVSTAGVTGEYGPFSEVRTFKIYIEPQLALNIANLVIDEDYEQPLLTRYPLKITAENDTLDSIQKPIGYSIEIKAAQEHEAVNYKGEIVLVAEGEVVFSKHYDIDTVLSIDISANDVDLTSNVEYTLVCTMAMDSGLVSEAFVDFIASFEEVVYAPDAEIILNDETFTAVIAPNLGTDDKVDAFEGRVSVFRREYDGSLMEIAADMNLRLAPAITDLHPSLDIPRYRIVVTNTVSGTVSFADVTGPRFANRPVIIQWAEPSAESNVSMLKLPYNIDISYRRKREVALVNYIGREHPVAYYGTQLNETPTWGVVIDAKDEATIYDLHRLSRWKDNVYVREPSGSGYYANISVTFGKKHNDVVIPVNLEITRVEGGA